jgi:hypothetical protein
MTIDYDYFATKPSCHKWSNGCLRAVPSIHYQSEFSLPYPVDIYKSKYGVDVSTDNIVIDKIAASSIYSHKSL